ncbi:SDR family NAD(P)-dependent oxidoreductase [Rhodococcus baikonurensis]|jgi:NAD(P)-dependent dehydrogenase (short-subunit alcohol dehydrogenase family)|uniref:SDR family NAD(P)-dependent oxidoreductase n=1 Tax=Rhodococcus baikonurensis TaxID=172041 RepID=UPI00378D58BA
MVNTRAADADQRRQAEAFVEALNREGHAVALALGDIGIEHDAVGTVTRTVETFGCIDAQGHGRIVNTGSGVGAFGAPVAFPYITAKAAVFGMTLSAAAHNADVDICINTVSPIAYS